MRLKLKDYQEVGVDFLLSNKSALLADDPGLGKSAMSITALKHLKPNRALIVCPKSLVYTWQDEFKKWWPEARTIVAEPQDKIEKAEDNVSYIVPYSIISRFRFDKSVNKPDVIIVDEAHRIANRKRQATVTDPDTGVRRSKKVPVQQTAAIVKIDAERKILLTGTPITSRPKNLWSLWKYLFPKECMSEWNYYKHYCGAYKGKWGWNLDGCSNVEELEREVSKFMLRRLKQDVLDDLPDMMVEKIRFDIQGYTEGLQANLELSDELGEEILAVREATGIKKVPFIVSRAKEILETENALVIFAYHKKAVSELKKKLKKFGVSVIVGEINAKDRHTAVKDFQDGKNRVFLGNLDACSEGITLTAARIALISELPYVPGVLEQASARIHRISQTREALVQILIANGTIDEQIYETLTEKKDVIEKIIKKTEKAVDKKPEKEYSKDTIKQTKEVKNQMSLLHLDQQIDRALDLFEKFIEIQKIAYGVNTPKYEGDLRMPVEETISQVSELLVGSREPAKPIEGKLVKSEPTPEPETPDLPEAPKTIMIEEVRKALADALKTVGKDVIIEKVLLGKKVPDYKPEEYVDLMKRLENVVA